MARWEIISLCFIASIPLASTLVFLLHWKRLIGLKTVDKLFVLSWLVIFTWAFVGVALVALTHRTFFVLRGQVAVFGIILLSLATIFWLAYRLFKASPDADKRRVIPRR